MNPAMQFQWNPTLFCGIGLTAAEMLHNCSRRIRDYWRRVEGIPANVRTEGMPPFFHFLVFLDDDDFAAFDMRKFSPDSSCTIAPYSKDSVDANLEKGLSCIANSKVNTENRFFSGYKNNYEFIDIIVVACLEEVENADLLIAMMETVANRFKFCRSLGLFSLEHFSVDRTGEKRARDSVGEIDGQMKGNKPPFTRCILLEEPVESGLKYCSRIDAIHRTGAFLFTFSATQTGMFLKNRFFRQIDSDLYFSIGLMLQRFDDECIAKVLGNLLFSEMVPFLAAECESNDCYLSDDEMDDFLRIRIIAEPDYDISQKRAEDDVAKGVFHKDFLEREAGSRYPEHLEKVGEYIDRRLERADTFVHRQLTGMGKKYSLRLCDLQARLHAIRSVIITNVDVWERYIDDVKKRVRVIEEKLKRMKSEIPGTTAMQTGYRHWIWAIPILLLPVAYAVFRWGGIPTSALYLGCAVGIWLLTVVICFLLHKYTAVNFSGSRSNPAYRKLEEELERLKSLFQLIAIKNNLLHKRVYIVDMVKTNAEKSLREIEKYRSMLSGCCGNESANVSIIGRALAILFEQERINPAEVAYDHFSNVGDVETVIEQSHTLFHSIRNFCIKRFENYTSTCLVEHLTKVRPEVRRKFFGDLFEVLFNGSKYLWRHDVPKIKELCTVFGCDEAWQPLIEPEAKRALYPVEMTVNSGSKEIVMIQVAEGIVVDGYRR